MHANRFQKLAVLTVVFYAAFIASSAQTAKPTEPSGVDMQFGVKIPLRDGTLLNATLYRPHDQKEPLPVIFTFTPYVADTYTDRAMYFASHGYVYALVDVRGRGNSGGSFEPFVNEGKDGYDVTEWLAKQPYANGKVAMWGGSYAGFDQWATVKELPPHLTTIVPAAAAHPGIDFPWSSGIAAPYLMQWLTYTSLATANINTFSNSKYWNQKARLMFKDHLPFENYDKLVGVPSPIFQKWLQHPAIDAYFDAMAPTPEQYAKINQPILTITGHYDGDQLGALSYYNEHVQYGSAEAKAKHYLIIGPWDHAGTRTPKQEMGGLKFAAASALDLNKLHTEWYDWTMKGGSKPAFLQKRVAYYVMGAEKWKYADSLESISNENLKMYLGSDGSAGDVFHSGWLSRAAGKKGADSDSWVYDPLQTSLGLSAPEDDPAYLLSQWRALNIGGEGLVYQSEPLTESMEVTGVPKLTAWLTMDVPDTDLGVEIDEILPDGSSVVLTNQVLRARYRESLRKEVLVPLNTPQKYVFNQFTFFSRQLAKGSRIRLLIGSINDPNLEKNYNSGGVVAKESAKDARTAHVRLLHDQKYDSLLELPVVH